MLSATFFRNPRARSTMTLKLFAIEENLRAAFTSVIFAGGFVNAEHVFFEIVTGRESFRANVTPMVPLIEMDAENVSSDSRFVAECFVTPITAEL